MPEQDPEQWLLRKIVSRGNRQTLLSKTMILDSPVGLLEKMSCRLESVESIAGKDFTLVSANFHYEVDCIGAEAHVYQRTLNFSLSELIATPGSTADMEVLLKARIVTCKHQVIAPSTIKITAIIYWKVTMTTLIESKSPFYPVFYPCPNSNSNSQFLNIHQTLVVETNSATPWFELVDYQSISIIIFNPGPKSVTIHIAGSPDGTVEFLNTSELIVYSGATQILTPKYYCRYLRLHAAASDSDPLQISYWIQAQGITTS